MRLPNKKINELHSKDKKTAIIQKEQSQDGKSSKLVIQLSTSFDNQQLITLLDEKRLKVLRWENKVETANGEKVEWVGMKSVNKLDNKENFNQLTSMTEQFIAKKGDKEKTSTTKLMFIEIVGLVENANSFEKEFM